MALSRLPERGATSDSVAEGSARGIDAFVTSILGCVSQPVLIVDQDRLIRFANPSAVSALGYDDVSELLGKNAHQAVHYKRPDGTAFPVDQCPVALPRATGPTLYGEDWLVRRDGSLFPVECRSAPIDMPGGRSTVLAFTDVSERHTTERDVAEARAAELAASEARQRAILEAALDGVISIDQQARITYANTAAELIFGYRADELIGPPLAEAIVPPSLRQAHRDGFAKYLATGEARILDQRIEITAMRADGSEFPAELTITRTAGRKHRRSLDTSATSLNASARSGS